MAVERGSAGPEKIGRFDGCLLLVAGLFYAGGSRLCFAFFACDVCGRGAWVLGGLDFCGHRFSAVLGASFQPVWNGEAEQDLGRKRVGESCARRRNGHGDRVCGGAFDD